MESVKKRPRWILALAVVAVAGATILSVSSNASAVTGSPSLTLMVKGGPNNLTTRTIIGEGDYSDPDGVCAVGPGVVVNWDIRTVSFSGTVVASGSTTTDANGHYTFTSIGLTKRVHYYITASVTGSLSGGYVAPDVCPNTSATAEIASL